MSQQDFLTNFQNSLDKLNGLNANINDNNIKNQREFNSHVVSRLQEIIQKINALGEKIKLLKNAKEALQNKVNDNNSGIADKDRQITQLTQQIKSLTEEKTNLQQQNQELTNQTSEKTKAIQTLIDEKEVQLRNLQSENDTLKSGISACESQLAALKTDVESRGTATQQQHANEIQKITDAHNATNQQLQKSNSEEINALQSKLQELNDKLTQNQQQIAQLTQQITEKDKQIEQLTTQNNNNITSSSSQIQELQKTIQDSNAKLQQLQSENEELKKQNLELSQKIQQATQVINAATDNLQTLSNAKIDPTEIDNLLAEVEKAIASIDSTLEGNNSTNSTTSQQPVSSTESNASTSWVLNHLDEVSPLNGYSYRQVITLLDDQIRNIQPKYKQQKITDKQMFLDQKDKRSLDNLIRLNLKLTTDGTRIKGGTKKTKKNKKQKGGFTYNLNAKRTPLSSTYKSYKTNKKTKTTIRRK